MHDQSSVDAVSLLRISSRHPASAQEAHPPRPFTHFHCRLAGTDGDSLHKITGFFSKTEVIGQADRILGACSSGQNDVLHAGAAAKAMILKQRPSTQLMGCHPDIFS
jgi:hypothetical protein